MKCMLKLKFVAQNTWSPSILRWTDVKIVLHFYPYEIDKVDLRGSFFWSFINPCFVITCRAQISQNLNFLEKMLYFDNIQ